MKTSSIFNDVLGPVMRGPSSSHVAGAYRIAQLFRMMLNNQPKEVICFFDPNTSLVNNHYDQGTDMGFAAGIANIDLTDEKMLTITEDINQYLKLEFKIKDYSASHPNSYYCVGFDNVGNSHRIKAKSTGGGMIEINEYDDYEVNIQGDYYELLIKSTTNKLAQVKKVISSYDEINQVQNDHGYLINVKRNKAITSLEIHVLRSSMTDCDIILLEPILPTLSSKNTLVDYRTADELISYLKKSEQTNKPLWHFALEYEAKRGNTTKQQVLKKAEDLFDIMLKSCEQGLQGTEFEDRILGFQSGNIDRSTNLIPTTIINNVIKCITAIMEVKSSMGVICAAPTCGSCGCLPGTLIGMMKTYDFTKEEIIKALLSAGLIGAFFNNQATFAAKVAGCQVECGAGSGMSAAAICQLWKGTAIQSINAASVALQNITGLCCDPVADRVEVPCLGKNIMAGTNAISSCNMILAGYDYVIPFDQTVKAMLDIGLKMPQEIKCTLGGLGKTLAARKIFDQLNNKE